MKRRHFLLGLSLALTGSATTRAASSSSNIDDLFSNPAQFRNLNKDIDALLPTAEESRWQTVPWRNNLMAARKEAQSANKPLFLWIMNGNPMGCT